MKKLKDFAKVIVGGLTVAVLSSINYIPKKKVCDCVITEQYYFKGKLVKSIKSPNGFYMTANASGFDRVDGEILKYDSLQVRPIHK